MKRIYLFILLVLIGGWASNAAAEFPLLPGGDVIRNEAGTLYVYRRLDGACNAINIETLKSRVPFSDWKSAAKVIGEFYDAGPRPLTAAETELCNFVYVEPPLVPVVIPMWRVAADDISGDRQGKEFVSGAWVFVDKWFAVGSECENSTPTLIIPDTDSREWRYVAGSKRTIVLCEYK